MVNGSVVGLVGGAVARSCVLASSRQAVARLSTAAATAAGAVSASASDLSPPPVTVPSMSPRDFPDAAFEQLRDFVRARQNLVVFTGAGCSTESGIPDYRSPNGAYSKGYKPVMYAEFSKYLNVRKRYWARSMTGWHRFKSIKPNPTHHGIVHIENTGIISGLVTQNVDRLHQKAGSKDVVELHGSQYSVSCQACRHMLGRQEMQDMLEALNPDWLQFIEPVSVSTDPFTTRPDGDADLRKRTDFEGFNVPPCPVCGGMLKPDVVFFGENVPREVVDRAMDLVKQADGVIAAGTSLQVYSVFRFIRAAHERSVPVALVNMGPTRADDIAVINVQALTSTVFSRLVQSI